MVPQSHGDSVTFFKTKAPPRGFISLSTGKPYEPPHDGRFGGDPYRYETDEEYDSRVAAELRGE